MDDNEIYYVVKERGVELERTKCKSIDDALYYIFSSITFAIASRYASLHQREGLDVRWPMFEEQLRLMELASKEWRQRKEEEIKEILRKAPYEDGLPRGQFTGSWSARGQD